MADAARPVQLRDVVVTAVGNPRCRICGGTGYVTATHGKRPCQCVTGTAATRRLMRRMNSIGATFDLSPLRVHPPKGDDDASLEG